MLKRLHSLIIKSFLPPFTATFLVTWFVFMVQFFWLYVDDLVGKGLETSIILRLIFFLAPTIVPIALPLGILLAAIMTFGNLAESSELTAVRSAGISLGRFSLPLVIFIIGITGATFLFNNYVIPVANLKFWTLLSDISNTKPAVNLRAGAFFNEIPGFSIYIDHKEDDNRTVKNIIIYDQSTGRGNDRVIIAKTAEMYLSDDKKFLIFELRNGCRYEEKQGKAPTDQDQVRLKFKYWKKIFDLSSFEMRKTDQNYLKSNDMMLNNRQLSRKIDSSARQHKEYTKTNLQSMLPYSIYQKVDTQKTSFLAGIKVNKDSIKRNFITNFPDTLQSGLLSTAESNLRGIKGIADILMSDSEIQNQSMNHLRVAWHKKITLAVSCLVLFLIGAPLGALIRKGGFGLPFIIAVLFFVLYYFMTVFGEKLSTEGTFTPIVGMWSPLVILLIIGLVLLYQANRDKQIIRFDAIFNSLTQFIKRKLNKANS
jgi:lipopolysaccharide export system permease protein